MIVSFHAPGRAEVPKHGRLSITRGRRFFKELTDCDSQRAISGWTGDTLLYMVSAISFLNNADFSIMTRTPIKHCVAISVALFGLWHSLAAAEPSISIRQITFGPQNHFFGYIGHVQNIPWNASGRYILALETSFQDRMPRPEDAANVVLIDTENDYSVRVVDQSRGWNPQQGTMFYWNPKAPETQFFFNDRDPSTGKVFCVLFDISAGEHGKRIREYRFEDTPIGNSGVAQQGGFFLGINYGRMDRLRRVTGYPGAYDWTIGENHPNNDGVFKVDVETGKRTLLVSFRQLAGFLKTAHPHTDATALFINHTLWNREDDRVFFFARGNFGNRSNRINAPFIMRPDGSGLTPLDRHIGGHPEWDYGHRMIGRIGDRQIIYDVDRQFVVGTLGSPDVFPNPEGDIALSPDGRWFVNGYKIKKQNENRYVIHRRSDGWTVESPGFNIGQWLSGDLRQDPSPNWNRDSNQILVPAVADDENKTRQLFIITLN